MRRMPNGDRAMTLAERQRRARAWRHETAVTLFSLPGSFLLRSEDAVQIARGARCPWRIGKFIAADLISGELRVAAHITAYRDARHGTGQPRMGRRPIGDAAMTAAERQQRRRAKLRASIPAPSSGAARKPPAAALDLLALDADAIAALIFDAVSVEKASRIVAALQRRMWRGRPIPG